MAESLLLPVVRGLATQSADALVQRVADMRRVEEYRKKLQDHLRNVASLLADAELKAEANTPPGHAVKAWMKKFKAVAYQADDVLDDFRYEALRREAQPSEFTLCKVLSFLQEQLRRLMFYHKASTDLSAVLTEIDILLAEMNNFNLMRNIPEVRQDEDRQTHSAPEEYTVGRDGDRDKVVDLLLKKQEDQKDVHVLPIIGMGGLGKTTLAKMVYNHQRVQEHFGLKMWHCVSENFEATTIVRSLIELATNRRCNLSDNIEVLRRKLQEVIGRKRCLLILDDVWNEKLRKWEDGLKPLLCSCIGGSGSMIVVTTRSQRVASIMGTLQPHQLRCLREDDSWELFSRKAFSKGVEMQAEFVTIGKRIVRKCKGLPLALKTMGGLMSSIRQVQQWETIAESNIGDTPSGKDEILPTLKLSYKHLPPEMKRCFAFCAIFPKDFVMEKNKLIELWLANGFIHEEETMELAQRAEFVFNQLAWRSFLEDVEVRGFYDYRGSYEAVGCKMHDLVHDLAKSVSDECAFAEELDKRKALIQDVHHMHVSSPELEKISGLVKEASSLRTLLIEAKQTNAKDFKLTSLRALRCGDASIIHVQLIKVVHLRYLDLSGSDIAELPNEVSKMYNLLSLRLIGCTNLRYLPEGVTALRNLSYLYLLGCWGLERMPPKLSLLKNLRILTTFIVGAEDGCGIEELRGLGQHGYRLELYNLRNVKSGSTADLHDRKNLSELCLYWGRLHDESKNDEACNTEQVLESLAPHGELKYLKVDGYGGVAIPQWMKDPGMFRCLKKLSLSNCARCKELPTVWLSSSLEALYLFRMDSLTTLCKNVDAGAAGYNSPLQIFPKLNMMSLQHLPELEGWAENIAGEPVKFVVFPLLKELFIQNCDKLAVAKLVMPIEDQPSERQTQLGHGGCFPSLEELKFFSCSNIVRWPTEELQCFPRLRYLSFVYCSKLEGRGSSSDGFLPLTQLEEIEIQGSRSLLEIPMLPASLENVRIGGCGSLVALPSNLGNLAKLRKLWLWECHGLRAVPDGMDGLTSLEELTIHNCPGIEEFPQGLLQRLPTLQRLRMNGCPDLQRRCREGGEYFDLVSSIRTIHVPAARAETE